MRKYSQLKTKVIAGPCALESKEQLDDTVKSLKELGVEYVRASLWKPRTAPGWEGYCFYGLPMLFEGTLPQDMIPCTEILTQIHAQMVIDSFKLCRIKNPKALVWNGSRNQNHFMLRMMAEVLSKGPPELEFMFKNQLWLDQKHWYGMYQHITEAGFPKERLISCHRGFNPGYGENPRKLRNIPEFKMAMEMKEKMGIRMFLDPSHIGGERQKVLEIIEESLEYDFDGYIIEVHPNVDNALTDIAQQLTFAQLEQVLKMIQAKETKK